MKDQGIKQNAVDQVLDFISYTERQKNRQERFQQMIDRAEKRKKRKRINYSIAAAVVMLIGTAGLIVLNQSHEDPETLFKNYYQKHVFPLEYRSDNQDHDTTSSAFQMFNEGEINEAARKAEALLKSSPTDPDVIILLASIQMEQQNYHEAIKYLNELDSFGGAYLNNGLWYKGLCYLALGESDQARECLRVLQKSNNHTASKKSKEILKCL